MNKAWIYTLCSINNAIISFNSKLFYWLDTILVSALTCKCPLLSHNDMDSICLFMVSQFKNKISFWVYSSWKLMGWYTNYVVFFFLTNLIKGENIKSLNTVPQFYCNDFAGCRWGGSWKIWWMHYERTSGVILTLKSDLRACLPQHQLYWKIWDGKPLALQVMKLNHKSYTII